MKIFPLTGQCLVRLLAPDYLTPGGLTLPDSAQHQDRGEKAKASKALVIAIGPWRKTRKGLAIVPDFHAGQTVFISDYSGTKLDGDIGQHLRILKVSDVLAVCEHGLNVDRLPKRLSGSTFNAIGP